MYLMPVADVLAYCLMPNHFHFLLRFKSQQACLRAGTDLAGFENLQGLQAKPKQLNPSQQLSNMLNAYAKAFNKKYHRKGSLFMRNSGRVKVEDNQYLLKLIHYIHCNPKEAGLVEFLEDWKYSSYKTIVSNKNTLVRRKEVIELFDDVENFKYVHKLSPPNLAGF